MIWLSDRAGGRDNNFNLIRFAAAAAVLVSHAVPVALGTAVPEPFEESYGVALGTLAVYVFFAISGFLITASFERSSSRTSFVLARVLRIMPGLFASLVIVTWVMGPLVTAIGAGTYLSLSDPAVFFLKNLTMVNIEYYLPGVFLDNPVSNVVGSIWTLRHEVFAYVLVFAIGISGGLASRGRATAALLLCLLLQAGLTRSGLPLPRLLDQFLTLICPFLAGMAFHVWRSHIPLSWPLLAAALAVFVFLGDHDAGFWPMVLSLTYITFWTAYVPRGPLLAFNRLGDYSYGIYVYAFPVQGLMVWLLGPQGMWQNVLYSFPPVLFCGILSWHLVEKPCLDAKPRLLARLKPRARRT